MCVSVVGPSRRWELKLNHYLSSLSGHPSNPLLPTRLCNPSLKSRTHLRIPRHPPISPYIPIPRQH